MILVSSLYFLENKFGMVNEESNLELVLSNPNVTAKKVIELQMIPTAQVGTAKNICWGKSSMTKTIPRISTKIWKKVKISFSGKILAH